MRWTFETKLFTLNKSRIQELSDTNTLIVTWDIDENKSFEEQYDVEEFGKMYKHFASVVDHNNYIIKKPKDEFLINIKLQPDEKQTNNITRYLNAYPTSLNFGYLGDPAIIEISWEYEKKIISQP